MRRQGMTRPPQPNTPEPSEGTARADAAMRALVLLLARQAVREALAGTHADKEPNHGQQEPD